MAQTATLSAAKNCSIDARERQENHGIPCGAIHCHRALYI